MLFRLNKGFKVQAPFQEDNTPVYATDLEEAEKIVQKLGYNPLYRNKRVTEYKAGISRANYYGFRQLAPTQFDKETFRTKRINNKVYLVVGKLK